jgi:hypothetical protein
VNVNARIDPDDADRAELLELRDEARAGIALGDHDLAPGVRLLLAFAVELLVEDRVDVVGLIGRNVDEFTTEPVARVAAVGWRLGTEGLSAGFDPRLARQAEIDRRLTNGHRHAEAAQPGDQVIHGAIHVVRVFANPCRESFQQTPRLFDRNRVEDLLLSLRDHASRSLLCVSLSETMFL